MSLPTGLIMPGQFVAQMPMIAGNYYDSTQVFGGRDTGTGALVANILYAVPFIPVSLSRSYGTPVGIDRLAINITTGASAGKKLRLGVYALGSDGKPGSLIVDGGELAADSIAGVEDTVSQSLQCGVPCYLVVVSDGTPTVRLLEFVGQKTGQTVNNDNTLRFAWQVSLTYTAGVTVLPATFGSPSVSSAAPQIMVRVA